MPNYRQLAGDFSGAFADLGTFLPIVLGVLALGRIPATGLFIGFGLFALATALVYRRPIPVQPMKAVAAIVLAGNLDAGTLAATGVLLGVTLLLLSLSGLVDRLAAGIPGAVLSGVQVGVGLILAWSGFRLVSGDWRAGGVALLLLLLLQRTVLRSFSVPLVVAGFCAWSLYAGDQGLSAVVPGVYLPSRVSFAWEELERSAVQLLLPQLVLTLTNATVITAAIAAEYFPDDRQRLSPGRLALSTGGLNLILAPLGAFPMCHGAGGLVVQHRFGARSGAAPAIFGICCISLGLFLGRDAAALLQLLPLAAVGALLVFAGLDLAFSRRLFQSTRRELAVVLFTGLCCLALNVAAGLVAGWLAEAARKRWFGSAG